VAVVRVSAVACVRVPGFAAAAVVRCEPALGDRPLAVVRGTPPATSVVEANAAARARGVVPGMTEGQARARCPDLVRRPESEVVQTSAQQALLGAALAISPRVEDGGPGVVYVELAGLERLFGDAAAIGERLVRAARAVGLEARVGVASTRVAARVASHGPARVTVVPAGRERAVLAAAPLDVLALPPDLHTALVQWGIRDLGGLAALPRPGLATRLGPRGLAAQDLARGVDREPFRPWTPPPFWEEARDLDWEVTGLPALMEVVRGVVVRLTARLDAAHLATDGVELRLALASGARVERAIALAHPTRDPEVVLALVGRDLEARPPAAPVVGVAVSAHPVHPRPGQAVLGQPPAPLERDLAALLGRLVRLVGREHVGVAVVEDSHHPDAIRLAPFAPPDLAPASGTGGPAGEGTLALRRLRPPRAVQVVSRAGRPAEVAWGGRLTPVRAWAGPWRLSGEWWDTEGWAREEWDVLLADGTLCRLAYDVAASRWLLDGIYD
jgi:protein ImuB